MRRPFRSVSFLLNIPVNNFSVMSGRSHRFFGITSTFGRYLAQRPQEDLNLLTQKAVFLEMPLKWHAASDNQFKGLPQGLKTALNGAV